MATTIEPDLIVLSWCDALDTAGRTLRHGIVTYFVEIPDFAAITATGDVSATRTVKEVIHLPRWKHSIELRSLRPGSTIRNVSVVAVDDIDESTLPSEPIEVIHVPEGSII